MTHGISSARPARAAALGAALLFLAPFAQAAETATANHDPLPTKAGAFTLKLEPGVSFPLTTPQSDLFDTGGSLTIKGLWSLNRYLSLGPSLTYTALPTASATADFGTAWAFGPSLVLARPRDLADADRFHNISPWVDVDAQYVRTGPLNRPGFAIGAGAAMPIGKARAFWFGPFVRYSQIIQGSKAGYDNSDAKILTVGLSLDVGAGARRPVQREAALPAEVRTVVQETVSCPDRDADGVPDSVDRCPDVAGPWETYGCPPYKKVTVLKDRLELKEKLFFDWDKATLQPESYPVLDEVVLALQQNKGFKVQVQGHTSSEGRVAHNQALSEGRAEAVLAYLVSHGIAKERLASKGFASTVPADTNTTVAGREKNRRVEFVVNLVIVAEGSK
jgi:outer membrane protein OmpA-like peptidoglycan-associated protein